MALSRSGGCSASRAFTCACGPGAGNGTPLWQGGCAALASRLQFSAPTIPHILPTGEADEIRPQKARDPDPDLTGFAAILLLKLCPRRCCAESIGGSRDANRGVVSAACGEKHMRRRHARARRLA